MQSLDHHVAPAGHGAQHGFDLGQRNGIEHPALWLGNFRIGLFDLFIHWFRPPDDAQNNRKFRIGNTPGIPYTTHDFSDLARSTLNFFHLFAVFYP